MNNVNDEYYMKLAIALARKGRGYVSPNPLVGAVIVKNGRIISRGYHQRFGGNHAEINAHKKCRLKMLPVQPSMLLWNPVVMKGKRLPA